MLFFEKIEKSSEFIERKLYNLLFKNFFISLRCTLESTGIKFNDLSDYSTYLFDLFNLSDLFKILKIKETLA